MPKKTVEDKIDELERMVKRGFDETATKTDLNRVEGRLSVVIDDLELVKADIHDIKMVLGPLVRHTAAMEERVIVLEKKMGRVERKVGLA